MADTGTFPDRSDLSDYGRLNLIENDLRAKRDATKNKYLRVRYSTLIANCLNAKNSLTERPFVLRVMASNAADLERFKAGAYQ